VTTPVGTEAPRGSAQRRLFGAGYVISTFLSFPHPVSGVVVDLGIVLAWLSPACLLLALRGLVPWQAARCGLGLGLLAHAAVLHWAYVVTVVYGNAHPALGVLAPLGMALYPALFTAAFAGGVAWLAQRGVASVFVLAALWTALDHGRAWFLGGFPWATIGYAQHDNGWLLGIVSVTGVYGLSFAVALGGASLARLQQRGRPSREAWVGLAVVALLHGAGPWLRADRLPADAPTIRIGAVQGNVDQAQKWSASRFDQTLRDYEDGTRDAAARGASVVVWPESAVTVAVEYENAVRSRISRLARETETTLVFGSVGAGPHPDAGIVYYDSAFTVGPDGAWLGRYDKTHLVPFGEYVPLRWLIGRVASAVATGVSSQDIQPGERPVAMPLEPGANASPRSSTLRVGVPICYELLFPDLMRRFVRDGAGVLLAVTNDAWYGRTGAPYQFLAMTALRSAETGVWTVRAANTGVSAVIDAAGRVLEETPIFEPAVLVADVPVRPADWNPTFYVRHGDVFAAACWGIAGVAICWAVRRARGSRADKRDERVTER